MSGTISALFVLFAATFTESKTLALQLHLDRAGYSCNTADGVWGPKGERALRRFLLDRGEKPVPLAPDATPKGKKVQRYVWPPGENCPVGVAWLGLNLPGYGLHGTPVPESVGFTGSHGCFRLANWNAARLYAMCRPGTKGVIEP